MQLKIAVNLSYMLKRLHKTGFDVSVINKHTHKYFELKRQTQKLVCAAGRASGIYLYIVYI